MLHRRLLTALLIVIAAVSASQVVTGRTGFAVTHGVSMHPTYYQGDLVVVAKAREYHVGQIAAYHDPHGVTVLHRIVGGDPRTGLFFKGDNNRSTDLPHPTAHQLLGRAVLHIPHGGLWLRRATSPQVLGLLVFAVLAGGGTAVHRRRRRRRREMSRHAARTSTRGSVWTGLSPALRTAAAAAAGTGALGMGLGAFAWSGPMSRSVTSAGSHAGQLAFSYTALVPPTAAYDTTLVRSPSPVFRKLASSVDVQLAYRGTPGTLGVEAELSTPGGWRSTIALAPRQAFTADRFDTSVRLDLPALEARAAAASKVTGLASSPLTISVVAKVQSQGRAFAPSLALTDSLSALSLPGDVASLVVKDTSAPQQTRLLPRTLSFRGRALAATTARTLSAMLLGTAALALLVLALFARSTAPITEGAAIRRRWSDLLVEVQPVPTPQGRPLVDVTSFETLVKLAERYGLLVLHWNRSDVDTFVVQDEGTTFRYRTTAAAEQRELVRS